MKLLIFVATTALMVFCSSASATDVYMYGFRNYYKPVLDETSTPYHYWLDGYSDAIEVSYKTLKAQGKPTLFCLPAQFDFRSQIPILIQEFDARQEKAGKSIPDNALVSAIALQALSAKFPCST